MINFYDLVPSIYTDTSRDFQYLSWLINVVLNSVKHNVDRMYDLPNQKADPRITELLALTLGFKVKRNYNEQQLQALVSILPSILKYKGTKKAVLMAGKALLNAAGPTAVFDCSLEDNILKILLPEELIDVVLLTDLLPYILPAGVTCQITRKTETQSKYSTKLSQVDSIQTAILPQVMQDTVDSGISGLSRLFDSGEVSPAEFVNFRSTNKSNVQFNPDGTNTNKDSKDKLEDCINVGLLDNSIIPAQTQNASIDATTSPQKNEE